MSNPLKGCALPSHMPALGNTILRLALAGAYSMFYGTRGKIFFNNEIVQCLILPLSVLVIRANQSFTCVIMKPLTEY